jgi:DNA polymerase-1
MAAPRVFLLDGLALAYRSHFTFIRRPMINSKGEHTSALFGVAGTLIKLRDEHKPEYWALTWDSDQPTFRHREYAEYKATRSPMPEELVSQLPHLKELAAAIGLPLLEVPGFEADDIMATLANRAINDGLEAILVTPDKDLQQLIRPGVRVLSPRGREQEGEWIGEAEVEERWGVRPDQLGDVLALMGDSSDNIPGVPGVGQKTAARLISQFGNLDALYERIDEVKQPALHKRLTANREGAYFCRYLVTVREDVELPVSWENLVTRPADPVALQELGERFELRRLTRWAAEAREHRRAAPSLPVPSVAVEPAPVAQRRGEAVQGALSFGDEVPLEVDAFGPPVRIIDTPAALTRLAEELVQSGRGFCLDTETTSEEPMRATLVGVGVTIGERPAYVPIRHREGKNLPIEKVREILGPVLADPATVKVGQHLKYDSLVLLREGFPVAGLGFDTLIASYLLEPEGAHGLDHLSRLHLGVEKIPTRALLGGRRGSRTMDELPIDVVGAYCGEDVHCTWLLRDLFEPELASRQQENLFHEVEMELVQVLVDMEREGVYVDTGFLAVMSEELGRELTRLEASIHSAAGGPFNINSGPQLSEILFKKLGLPARRQTKTGFSTSADVLEELAPLHALPRLILQFRQSAKLKSTYVDAIPALILPDTGRVHTEFHQTVAATGRLSSSNPGLQNIPTRTPLGREVRKAFRSRPGWHLLGADYSQIELRIMAHLSGDTALTEAFARGDDVHASTARRIFSLGDRVPSPEQRAQAKTVNFGVMYGMGARALSLQLGMPIGQASAFIHDYFKVHNGVADYLKALLEEARGTGYVHTVLGRRRYLPLLTASSPRARANAERAAINTPLQGSAADLIKVAMVRIHRQIQERGMESRLILQVHDELLFEFPPGEREELEEMVRREMTHAITLDIPLEVTIGVGERWFDVH